MIRALLLALIIFAAPIAAYAIDEKRLHIKDGDSFIIDDVEIRLWGIDAVEYYQTCEAAEEEYACGKQARMFLGDTLIAAKEFECERKPRAKRETREVAQCFVDGKDLAQKMVLNGWALDYTYFSNGYYKEAQRKAKAAKVGIWAGTFQRPADWKRDHPYKPR